MNVTELGKRYLREHASTKKVKSAREDSRQLHKYIVPYLGDLHVQSVQYEDIAGLHKRMTATPYQANRVLALLSKMFELAERWRLRDPLTNPTRHVNRFTERKRRRYMTNDEAPRVARALSVHGVSDPQGVAFIRLLIYTGARPSEIAEARPEWLDGAVLNLPDSKTGERSVFLSSEALEQFHILEPIVKGVRNTPEHLWHKIRLEVGCKDLRLYDLRHTFASAALKAGYTLDQIGELLGHRNANTTKRYAHLMTDKALEVAGVTSGVLVEMMS